MSNGHAAPVSRATCFIVNPVAGQGRGSEISEEIKALAAELPFRTAVHLTSTPGHGEELARFAAAEGFGIVAAVGGDGTVNEIGRGLLGTSAALSVIPVGSGNGLARHLKVPLKLLPAVYGLKEARVAWMDVGYINGHPFFCTAGIGFDAHVATKFATFGRRGLTGYAIVTAREYCRYRSSLIQMSLDDEAALECECYMLTFANASQFGNNAYIAPQADLHDGLLDTCLISKLPPLDAARIGYGMVTRTIDRCRAVKYARASHVKVECAESIALHVDGDPFGSARQFNVTTSPSALCVLI